MKKRFSSVLLSIFAAVIFLNIGVAAEEVEVERCEVISENENSALLVSVKNTDVSKQEATLIFAAYSGEKLCGLKTKTGSLDFGEKKYIMLNGLKTSEPCDSVEAWVINGWARHETVFPAKKFTAEKTKINYIYNENFDKIGSYSQTGISWAGKDNKNTLTLEKDGENGYLLIHSETSDPILIKSLTISEKKFIVEMKCRVEAQSGSKVTLAALRSNVNVQNGLAYTNGSGKLFDFAGEEIGDLNKEGFTRVSFAVDMETQKYDAYINGKLCKTDISLANPYGADSVISEIRILSLGKADTIVDDMKVYSGMCVSSQGENAGDWEYSAAAPSEPEPDPDPEPDPEPEPEPDPFLYIQNFDNVNKFSEIGWEYARKSNENFAEVEESAEDGNKYLKFHVEADQPILYKAINGIDASVAIEGDFRCSNQATMQAVPIMLRSKNGKGSTFVRILSGGKITGSDRENIVGQMNENGFTNIRVKLNNTTYSIIINGETAAENLPIPTILDEGDSYSEWRLTGFGGKGDLYIDNMKISK